MHWPILAWRKRIDLLPSLLMCRRKIPFRRPRLPHRKHWQLITHSQKHMLLSPLAWFGSIGIGPLRRENPSGPIRSEEHTSELQSLAYLVCRLLLEKKKHLAVYVLLQHLVERLRVVTQLDKLY